LADPGGNPTMAPIMIGTTNRSPYATSYLWSIVVTDTYRFGLTTDEIRFEICPSLKPMTYLWKYHNNILSYVLMVLG